MAITFQATSNKVSPTKVPTESNVSLEVAIRNNKALQAAFPTSNICIVQSSQATTSSSSIQESAKGLVTTVAQAYNQHHNLILRPDDIWQAILTQFSFYVNSKAERLRDKFVDFQGKKQLIVRTPGTLFTVDHGTLAQRMVDEQVVQNIQEPEVADWLLPGFSTTTVDDRVAASVSVMSTLQAYFEYTFELSCGIPQVTLEGTVEDWKKLRQKLDRLPQYDDDPKDKLMTEWHELLVPVVDQLVRSAEGRPNLHFWDTICHHHGGGSGPRYLSGWITVFACFDKDGNWQGRVPHVKPGAFGFRHDGREFRDTGKPKECQYPFINTNKLPIGALSVPVLVNDNGTEYNTQMVAGQMAYEIVDDKDRRHDTIRSRTDWCIAYDVDQHKIKRQKTDQPNCVSS